MGGFARPFLSIFPHPLFIHPSFIHPPFKYVKMHMNEIRIHLESRLHDTLLTPINLSRRKLSLCFVSECIRRSLTDLSSPMKAPRIFVAFFLVITPALSNSCGNGSSSSPPNQTHFLGATIRFCSSRSVFSREKALANRSGFFDAIVTSST